MTTYTGNSNSLLREQVVAHRLRGSRSTPVMAIANYFKLQLVLWTALLFVATYLLTKIVYKQTVPSRGFLEPSAGSQIITSPTPARVELIHVRQGDHVVKGDILASLNTDIHDGRGVSIGQENIAQLRFDRKLLAQQLDVLQAGWLQSRHWDKVAEENVRENAINLDRESELLEIQSQLSSHALQAVSRLLDARSSSKREYDQYYQAHMEHLLRNESLRQRMLQNDHSLQSLENAEQLAQLDFKQSTLRIQRELQRIDSKIDSLSNQFMFTVVAQGPGVVAELALETGKPVSPLQPLFYINPIRPELQATIYVPASVQGKLELGQSLLLRYDAFDYRLYGRFQATVTAIGQARLDPRDSRLPVTGITEPVFKVVAALHDTSIGHESRYRLQSGATLVADFVVAEMSLLQFIFKPVLGLRGKVS